MGVPMRRTMVKIYALGGLYSALGGVVYALYTSSGYPLAGTGNEFTGSIGGPRRHFADGRDRGSSLARCLGA